MPDRPQTEVRRYNAGGRDLASYLAVDPAKEGKRPGLILLPEWWGLNDYLRRRARELAGLGFVALAAGMGVPGVRVDQPEDLAGALAEAFADGGPRLVEIGIEGKR